MSVPQLSVVLPVYNGARFLDEAIHSIAAQTFSDFELLILDDGSTDHSAALLQDWARRDDRIRLSYYPGPTSVARACNRLVRAARAPLVARMDQDDVSLPDRFRRQLEIFASQPRVVLVGTMWKGIDYRGRQVRPRDRWRLIRRSRFAPFTHGSAMLRRATFDRVGGYCERIRFGEDVDLFLRLAAAGQVMVCPEALYAYRYHADGTSITLTDKRIELAVSVYRHVARHAVAPSSGAGIEPAEEPEQCSDCRLRAIVSHGANRVWSGQKAGILRQLRSEPHLRLNVVLLRALAYGIWGELSPQTLRSTLAILIGIRDRMVALRLQSSQAVEWRYE
ncbi:MAG: glycosyltransferase family 2 protein [Chloroflexi bacterium]|nr:glycosyltransferase family 2 protein [Chloroflexota bacterium]